MLLPPFTAETVIDMRGSLPSSYSKELGMKKGRFRFNETLSSTAALRNVIISCNCKLMRLIHGKQFEIGGVSDVGLISKRHRSILSTFSIYVFTSIVVYFDTYTLEFY